MAKKESKKKTAPEAEEAEEAKSFEFGSGGEAREAEKQAPAEAVVPLSQYARLQADFENFKKRNRDTATRMYEEGVADVVKDVMPTLDNIDTAIAFQKDEAHRQALELVRKAFTDVLGKYGVEEMTALGEDFDPNRHEALMNRDEGPEKSGKVVEVLKKGYTRGGKVLRYPMVVVGE
ncbi:MAG TPA: nucleotide exchange factor GrpE [Candidatus Ornithoclostridium excrementipullorum]|nr:nucleotide exchange factor GrpE [Candidatus Ornithoclostridium excrementipullorum]